MAKKTSAASPSGKAASMGPDQVYKETGTYPGIGTNKGKVTTPKKFAKGGKVPKC